MITMAQQLVLSLPLIALPLTANAFNVGQLNPRSREGESLDATIELYLAPHERAMPMVVTLAPDLFSPQRSSTETLLRAIVSEVEHYPDGYSAIRLRSATPLDLAGWSFRLRVQQGAQTLSRVFSIELPPPLKRYSMRNSTLRPATTGTRYPEPGARLTATTYGPVRSGDTLWAIAKKVRGSSSLNATMQALHAANPHAFVNADIDRLKIGVTLKLPGSEERAARASVATSHASTRTAEITEDFFASETETSPGTTVAVSSAAAAISRDPALTRKLAELDAKFAAIRAQYAEPSKLTQPPRVATAISTQSAFGAAEPAATVAPIATPAAARVAPTIAIAAPATTAVPASEVEVEVEVEAIESNRLRPVTSGTLMLIGLVLAAILTGAVVAYARRQRQARLSLQAAFETREANRKAEIAAKAGRTQQEPAPQETRVAPDDDLAALDLAAALGGLEPAPTVASLLPSLENTQDDIDASIAHGRYQDAELLLQQVIAAAPRNVAAKLRLSEVYYISERVEAFSALAENLQLHHRGELTNDEWRRVMRMGKIIAPDSAIFAGPRAVSSG